MEADIEVSVTISLPVRPEFKDGELVAIFTNQSLALGSFVTYEHRNYVVTENENYDKWSRYRLLRAD